MSAAPSPTLQRLDPRFATPGGRVTITGRGLLQAGIPAVLVAGAPARVVAARDSAITFRVPPDLDGGVLPVRLGTDDTLPLEVGQPVATGLHQVDSPVFDGRGRLYLTYSGSRGEEVPVSIFRVERGGARESFSSAVVNPTSMAIGPDGGLYVSSRFEGSVYRIGDNGAASPVVTDAGVACGLAFDHDGALYIGDRAGTILRLGGGGRLVTVASIPPSVAAYHLAFGPDGWLYVTAPTLSSADRVWRVHPDGQVQTLSPTFGRPQGLGFDEAGTLFVVDALAGASGVYRLPVHGTPEVVVAGENLIGLAFDPTGGFVVVSNTTAYRFEGRPA